MASGKSGKKSDEILFEHTLSHKGYAYVLHKRYLMQKREPVLVISHSLRNTVPFPKNMAQPQLLCFDNKPVGPAYKVIFPMKYREIKTELAETSLNGTARGYFSSATF